MHEPESDPFGGRAWPGPGPMPSGATPPPGPNDAGAAYPPPPPSYGWPGTYGQQGAYGPRIDHPNGTTILVLGILSLAVCGLLGPFAWMMGNEALRELDAPGAPMYANRGNITAGRICGIIGTCLLAVGVFFFVIWLVIAGSLIAS